MSRHGRVYSTDTVPAVDRAKRLVMDTHQGWTLAKDHDSGLMFVYRPDGTKYGQTQTEAAARIMRRRAIVNAIPRGDYGGMQ